MTTWHPIYGTKCGKASMPIKPQTLGQVYQELVDQYGEVQLNKPVPGDTYRRMYKPLNQMDGPGFRQMPQSITVVSPARLYRSIAWKYNGGHHSDAQVMWTFDYEYEYGHEMHQSSMSVRFLTIAYIPQNLVPMDRSNMPPILDRNPSNHIQLSLF